MTEKKQCDDQMVSVSLSRQPVFDKNRRLWGYELACMGSGGTGISGFPEDDGAAVSLAAGAYIGLQQIIAREKKIIVNFNEKSILDDLPYALPPVMAAVQVSEHVYRHPAVPPVLDRLKGDGYMIAVAGYSEDPELAPLYDLADVIGIEIRHKQKQFITEAVQTARSHNALILARGVDEDARFNLCRDAGVGLFQGRFFKLPEMVTVRKLSSTETSRFNLLKIIESAEPDIEKLAETIQADASMSFRLLAYLNSAAFGFAQKIKSIQHAISILGWRKMKNWLRVVLLTDVNQSAEASELIALAAQRGKFLEIIATEHDYWGFDPESLHLLGLFSLLDVMLGIPMPQIVAYLPIETKIKAALCGEPNSEYYPLLELARCFEEARWSEAEKMVQQLNLKLDRVKSAFQSAIDWSCELSALSGEHPRQSNGDTA